MVRKRSKDQGGDKEKVINELTSALKTTKNHKEKELIKYLFVKLVINLLLKY